MQNSCCASFIASQSLELRSFDSLLSSPLKFRIPERRPCRCVAICSEKLELSELADLLRLLEVGTSVAILEQKVPRCAVSEPCPGVA
jgi:hypothetical protein